MSIYVLKKANADRALSCSYEGKYRNVKVAIADIRGHLTENDLKELGLLRDLRHTNVVRFIGVSIPTEKNVPVSIITELCSNGDLFDYIRNRPPPAFEKIVCSCLDGDEAWSC